MYVRTVGITKTAAKTVTGKPDRIHDALVLLKKTVHAVFFRISMPNICFQGAFMLEMCQE